MPCESPIEAPHPGTPRLRSVPGGCRPTCLIDDLRLKLAAVVRAAVRVECRGCTDSLQLLGVQIVDDVHCGEGLDFVAACGRVGIPVLGFRVRRCSMRGRVVAASLSPPSPLRACPGYVSTANGNLH